MRYLGVGLFLTLGVAFGSDCVAKISVEEASRQASQYGGCSKNTNPLTHESFKAKI
jgi:hypothetical protein